MSCSYLLLCCMGEGTLPPHTHIWGACLYHSVCTEVEEQPQLWVPTFLLVRDPLSFVQGCTCQASCMQASNYSASQRNALGFQMHGATVFHFLSIDVGSEEPNSGCQACRANTLPTEPSSSLCFATCGGRKSLLTIKTHQVENSQQTFRITASHNIKYLI